VIARAFPEIFGALVVVIQREIGDFFKGPVAKLVGIKGGVVSGVINLESSDV